jgi:N6-L-threonylcarbamoyladenine synthase
MMDSMNYDFSFSGLKTAFINYAKKHEINNSNISHVLASFQDAAFDVLVSKTVAAAKSHSVKCIVVGGGVASNGRLREIFTERGTREDIDVLFSSPQFCTDNGAMIAILGFFYFQKGIVSPIDIGGYSRMSIKK